MGKRKDEKKEIIKEIFEMMPDMYDIVYDGKRGNVEVYFYPEEDRREYFLFFDGRGILVNSLTEVMETPFIEGKAINDIANKIKIYKYEKRLY